MRPGGPQRWERLAVRDRLRALLPAARPADPADEPAGRRGLAMLLSVVVAVVLWFSFSMRETYAVPMEVPIEIVGTPAGRSLAAAPPGAASVVLQGEGWTLLGLMRRAPAIRVFANGPTVDLASALREGGLPADVDVQSVQPAVVELALDTETTRRLPIRLNGRIDTAPRYDLLEPPRLSPDSVLVRGAQSLLGGLSFWPTEPLTVEGLDDDLTRSVALRDTFGGLLVPSVRRTLVQLQVGEYVEDRRVLDVEVTDLPPGVDGVRFDPAQVEVVYRVPLSGEAFNRARTTDAFRAVVDYGDILRDSTSGEVPVAVRWPGDLNVRSVEAAPRRVGYFIQRRPPAEGGDR